MTKTAKFVSDISSPGNATQKLYALSPPMERVTYDDSGNEVKAVVPHVVVSAVVVLGVPETYVFEADDSGDIKNWSELDGSYRGGLSHEQALSRAGYDVS